MGKQFVHFEFPAEDVDRAARFWQGVGGWEIGSSQMPDLDYRMFQGGESWGGAVYPQQDGEQGPVAYLLSEDIEADIANVREHGGQADDKLPIPHIGWFARCKDTEGNPFSFFQSDESVAP